VEEHPGGDAILNNAGDDSTEGFFGFVTYHRLSNAILNTAICHHCSQNTLFFCHPEYALLVLISELIGFTVLHIFFLKKIIGDQIPPQKWFKLNCLSIKLFV
jgi:hypothetical protein